MKNKKGQQPITGPLLQDLVDQQKANFKFQTASLLDKPADEQPPDLYQDAGGGYNSNLVFPQE